MRFLYDTALRSVFVFFFFLNLALKVRSLWSQMFIGPASVIATTIVKSSREHTGIKSAMKKSTPTTLLHYRWETKVKQFFLATDEIVALHAMHTDIQPGRVVMKQRPLLVTLHLLKNRKSPSAPSASSWCAIGSRGHWFIRQRGSSLMDGTQSNARPIRCSPNRRERAFAGREINK